MGETNTSYDPGGHFLISVVGNYERQEPTPMVPGPVTAASRWA